MQNTVTDYNIVKGTAADEELKNYLLCFEKDGTFRDMENLHWIHHQNLLHKNVIYYAMIGDVMAGIYTALPVIFRINNELRPALQSIDTLTDIDHRGKGLFIKLANKLYKEAAENKFALVYGFPNENSAPGFFKKLQWSSFGEAPFLIKPLSTSYFIKKILYRKRHTDFSSSNYIFNSMESKLLNKDTVIKAMKNYGDDYDITWKLAAKNIKVCVDRSAMYMNWRYVDKPGEHYYRYGLYKNNKLAGAIVFAIKHKHDGLIGYIMELIFDPSDSNTGEQLLKFSTRIFRKSKVDVVLAWCFPGSFNYSAYKKKGYYKLPEKLRPQQLYLGAKVLDESNAATILDVKNWYISYSDSDTA